MGAEVGATEAFSLQVLFPFKIALVLSSCH